MRKSLVAVILLLVLSVSVLAIAHQTVSKKQTELQFEITDISGDPDAADGLKIQLHTEYINNLDWDTNLYPGSFPHWDTEFTYRESRSSRYLGEVSHAFLHTQSLTDSFYGRLPDENSLNDYPQLILQPMMDAANRTAPGETRTETFNYHDYLDWQPVYLDCYSSDYSYYVFMNDDFRDVSFYDFGQFFQFPLPDHNYTMTLTKGQDNDIDCEIFSEDDSSGYGWDGIVTEHGIVFAITTSNEFDNWNPEQYGIYYFPLSPIEELNKNARLLGNPYVVFPLDFATQKVVNLLFEEKTNHFLLFVEEQGETIAYVLDCDTFDVLQTFPILDDFSNYGITLTEDTLFLPGENEDFQLYVWENNAYHLWIQDRMQFQQIGEYPYFSNSVLPVFDGKKLALIGNLYYSGAQQDTKNGVFLQIYNSNGTQYAGLYHMNKGMDRNLLYDTIQAAWEETK